MTMALGQLDATGGPTALNHFGPVGTTADCADMELAALHQFGGANVNIDMNMLPITAQNPEDMTLRY